MAGTRLGQDIPQKEKEIKADTTQEQIAKISADFAQLARQKDTLTQPTDLKEWEKNNLNLLDEVDKLERKLEQRVQPGESAFSRELLELALIKAKIQCAYYQDFQVLQKDLKGYERSLAIRHLLARASEKQDEIGLFYWGDGLFLFQLAFHEGDVAAAVLYAENIMDRLLKLDDMEKRAAILGCVANGLYSLLEMNIALKIKEAARKEQQQAEQTRAKDTREMVEEVSLLFKEINEGKKIANEKKADVQAAEARKERVAAFPLKLIQRMGHLLEQCFLKQLTNMEFIMANMEEAYNLWDLNRKIQLNYPGLGINERLASHPDYQRFHVAAEIIVKRTYFLKAQQDSVATTYKQALLNLAHVNSALGIIRAFREEPSLMLAVKGFFNAESPEKLRNEYKNYIMAQKFIFGSGKKVLLNLLQIAVNQGLPSRFPPDFVDIGMLHVLKTFAPDSIAPATLLGTYHGFYKKQFGRLPVITLQQEVAFEKMNNAAPGESTQRVFSLLNSEEETQFPSSAQTAAEEEATLLLQAVAPALADEVAHSSFARPVPTSVSTLGLHSSRSKWSRAQASSSLNFSSSAPLLDRSPAEDTLILSLTRTS